MVPERNTFSACFGSSLSPIKELYARQLARIKLFNWCKTRFFTQCLMIWDWIASRAGLKCLFPYLSHCSHFHWQSFLFIYLCRLVMLAFCLRINWVPFSSSLPCITSLLLSIIIVITSMMLQKSQTFIFSIKMTKRFRNTSLNYLSRLTNKRKRYIYCIKHISRDYTQLYQVWMIRPRLWPSGNINWDDYRRANLLCTLQLFCSDWNAWRSSLENIVGSKKYCTDAANNIAPIGVAVAPMLLTILHQLVWHVSPMLLTILHQLVWQRCIDVADNIVPIIDLSTLHQSC